MKKNRVDSAAGAVNAMLNAAKSVLEAPSYAKLRPGDLEFWPAVVCARARDEWTDADLVVAVQLARCMHDIEVQQVALDGEGPIIENGRGTQIMNPRVTVMEQLARREMALMRTLRMGGRVTGAADKLEKARKTERQSRSLRQELEDDELLA